jgi:hypothetical protein
VLALTDDLSAIDAWESFFRRVPVTLSSVELIILLTVRGASSSPFAEPGFFHAVSAMMGLACFSCASKFSMSFISSISPLLLRTYVTLITVRQHQRAAMLTPTTAAKFELGGASSDTSVAIMAPSRAWA